MNFCANAHQPLAAAALNLPPTPGYYPKRRPNYPALQDLTSVLIFVALTF